MDPSLPQSPNLSGYVLAGGGSSRFGSDKALAVLAGRTVLQRTTDLVFLVCGNVRIIASRVKYPYAPAEILEDRWPGQGPLGGILTALRQTPTGSPRSRWNLIVGCDMPFLTRDWLAFLCQRVTLSDSQVIVAKSKFGLEPLCACWNSDGLGELQKAFDEGVRKATEAMKRLPMEVLDETAWKRFDTEGRLFWNMNTPADFEEAKRIIDTRAE